MKILVTGGTGLLGKSLQSIQKQYNYDFICNSRIMSLGSRGCTPAIFEGELEFLGKR